MKTTEQKKAKAWLKKEGIEHTDPEVINLLSKLLASYTEKRIKEESEAIKAQMQMF